MTDPGPTILAAFDPWMQVLIVVVFLVIVFVALGLLALYFKRNGDRK